MSKGKVQPNFKNMTKKEMEEWEEKMKYLEGDNKNTNATNQIRAGRGWMF